MKKTLIILVLLFIGFSVIAKAEEKPPLLTLFETGFRFNEISVCAGLAKYLEYERNSESRDYFERKYFSNIHDYLLTLIYFDMFEDFNYSNHSSYKIESKFQEYNKIQTTINMLYEFSVEDEDYMRLTNVFLNKCIPILIESSEETIDVLDNFKKRSIRKLTHLPSSN